MSIVAPGRPGSATARMLAGPRVRRPSRLWLALVVLLGMAPPAYLLQTGGALTTGYEIQKLERERTAWLNRNQQLEVEIARARSLAWVEHEAVNRLGMQRPQQTTMVRVDTPILAPTEARLLRRGSEPMPAIPIEDGPSWMDAIDYITSTLARGN
jgi:hypothetical protein